MGLVSGLYRMTPSEASLSRDESERRLTRWVTRLCAQYGREEVVRRIRAHQVPEHLVIPRAWLVLTAEAVPDRQVSGTF